MKSRLSQLAQKAKVLFTPESVTYRGLTLPAKRLRLCGANFLDDENFLSSGEAEAERLIKDFGLTANSRILDVGCGSGRLAIGLLSRVKDLQRYCGLDIVKRRIDWCQRHITRQHQNFRFVYLDVQNMRYNPRGKAITGEFRFPFADREFDIIYLWSVFSHMTTGDVSIYLREFQRLLDPAGKIFLTAFVEEGVPDVAINPKDTEANWKGPLHCVRYNQAFFYSLLNEAGFKADWIGLAQNADGQKAFHLSRK